jgi:hypothetical protein
MKLNLKFKDVNSNSEFRPGLIKISPSREMILLVRAKLKMQQGSRQGFPLRAALFAKAILLN